MRLIGLGGYEKAGKDAVADILVAEHGWQKTYMSEPLERALLALDPWIHINIIEYNQYGFRKLVLADSVRWLDNDGIMVLYSEIHKIIGYTESKKIANVVAMLQRLGTEVGRNIIGEQTWVIIAGQIIDGALYQQKAISITGIRYKNETAMIKARSGLLCWVKRPGIGPVNHHSSANTLTESDFDLVIENNGTLEDLSIQIATLVGEK